MNIIKRLLLSRKIRKKIVRVKKSLQKNAQVINEVHNIAATPEKLVSMATPLFERRRELELKLKKLKDKL